jgi:2-phosphosulfolactate phosphatase
VTTTAAADQSSYQIRLDWGAAGLARLAPAHITVIVDALPSATAIDHAGVEGLVVRADLTNRSAVARWILERQHENGGRTSVNLVLVGEEDRVALEDQLAAGAVVDALIELGIDHTSPDAAVACAAFTGLRRAVAHILSASTSGRLLRDAGAAEALAAAGRIDSSTVVDPLGAAAASA